MVAQRQQFSALTKTIIVIWLLIGPCLCIWLLSTILSGLSVSRDSPLALYGRLIGGGAVAGIAVFFLHGPLWQRALLFVLYAPAAGLLSFIAAIYVGCYVFHNCI